MRYVYSLIQFVPRPQTGEAVNIGAVVGSDVSREWSLRLVSNLKRARALDDARILDRVVTEVERIRGVIAGPRITSAGTTETASEDWLVELSRRHSHVLQFSEPVLISAAAADEAMDTLFSHVVIDPRHREPRRYYTRQRAAAAARRAYKDFDLESHVSEQVRIEVGKYRERFDFVVHAEDLAVQLVDAWSFQSPDQEALSREIKSWAWLLSRMRLGTGRATLKEGKEIRVDPDFDAVVLYVPPAPKQRTEAFEEATSAFRDLGVAGVRWNSANDIAERAQSLLRERRLVPAH